MDFDSAISLTGYGKFHYETLAACALSLISVGFQNGLSAYIFPAAQCELKFTSLQLGLLNVSFLVGGTLSSCLWGILADAKGRRKLLAFTHLTNATITVFCALNQYMITLIVCRFLNGFLIGAPGSIIFSYLAEFQPPKYRSSVLCYSGLFFTSSWLILPLLASFLLPLEVEYQSAFIRVNSWRLFMVILTIPEFITGLWFLRLPESPKFYVAKGNPRKALVILRRMYSRNTGKHPNDFIVKNLLDESKIETKMCGNVQCRGNTVKFFHEIGEQFRKLFTSPLMYPTMLVCAIMFANMFGVFGLGLWLPELFIRFERFQTLHPNATITIQQLSSLNEVKNSTCKPSFDSSVIQSTIAMGVSSLVGNALSGWFATRVPLHYIPGVLMMVGGVSAASIFWLRSSLQNLVVASIFQASLVTANMTIGSIVVDLFPTTVSAMAICFTMCAGRIGAMTSNFMFGLLMDWRCEVPIFVVAGAVLIGGWLCFLVPRRKKEDGVEDLRLDFALANSVVDTKF